MQKESKNIKDRAEKLELEMSKPENASDTNKYKKLAEEYASLRGPMDAIVKYESAISKLESAKVALKESEEEEFQAFAKEEIASLEPEVMRLKEEVETALVPPDPMDKKNAIMEIRAGAGGDEAGLFASELLRMYTMFSEKHGWKVLVVSSSSSEIGGVKDVILEINGAGAYGVLKYESGVHRVQRVPETEKSGRVHTSTVTVAVMPEVEQVEFDIPEKDLRIDATTSTGHGGQSVNTTYSAIRIVHLPTGIIVTCQDERSQKQNKERAMSIMRARLFAHEEERRRSELTAQRKGLIGTGDRSEKIRTYNFPQDRLTDHRIKETWHNLPSIMDGDIGEVISTVKKGVASDE
ncbi:TPA: peptide chain release factor 1 [Candidatus Uhrbacteria bacterium]|nr:peptide chain release factor 1 [Candidatus Uhrbacteria bacterium]